MKKVLNVKMLDVILLVQRYKQFLATENRVFESQNDFWNDTEIYYNDLPEKVLREANLNKNKQDFEMIMSYEVTDEIMRTTEDKLDQFVIQNY